MLETKENLAYDNQPKAFIGVRFVLFGFDSIKEHKVRSKLLEGGGVDAVNYDSDCNYVIVDKLAYDDPICVAARKDGKMLATGLWVDHSFDLGVPIDTTSVMYTPVKDLNGIPGAKSLVMCLTGYQRQDREDIMTMVALMGAKFSKPLVATKVTHLICYKFEGEKYELAKKIKIKLVNHRWLEDCLKAWQILPEADYSKSGHELEMETEVKDSEEETEDVASKTDIGRNSLICPQNTCAENKSPHKSSSKLEVLRKSLSPHKTSPKLEISKKSLSLSASKNLASVGNSSTILQLSGKEIGFEKTTLSGDAYNKNLEIAGVSSTISPGKMSSEVLSNIWGATVISENVEHVLPSASESAKKSENGDVSKSSSKSYYQSPPRKSSLPLRMGSTSGSPSASNISKHTVSGGFGVSLDRFQDGTDAGVKAPLKGTLPHLNNRKAASNKSKVPVSWGNSKSPTPVKEPKRSMGSKIVAKATEMLASLSSVDGSHGLAGDVSPKTVGCPLGEEASYAAKEASKFSATSEDKEKCSDRLLQHSPEGLMKRFSANVDVKDHSSSRTDNLTKDVEMHQSDLQSTEPPLPRTNPGLEKMNGPADLNYSKEGQSDSQLKPAKRKMLAKKTLGSRPTKFKTAKQKGSINLQRAVLQDECVTPSDGVIAVQETDNNLISEKLAKGPPADCSAGDKTEAPDQNDQNEYDGGHNEEKSAEAEASLFGKGVIHTNSPACGKILQMEEQVEKSVGDESSMEAKNGVCSERTELMELKYTGDAEENKLTKGRKRPFTKSKTKKLKESRGEVKESEPNSKQVKNREVSGKEETISLASKRKTEACKKVKNSDDVEKENKPVKVKRKIVSKDATAFGKVVSQLHTSRNGELKADQAIADAQQGARKLDAKSEPACFILSGHRLQRKEFQKLIKRLKGRVCRDSHNWSYQATHYVVPDPIRRTEKFFAAAASGSWILKTDYLTGSSEAGMLLSEEPYEWHKKCLSEDGAINLEAPRKWRLLKKRTGHGAFYGMRIVIYGECIAPPLDTLKRVVKAGDGTILATSPPYTRFLKSGIDFAVVSPSMPHVDVWVQEFLRHEVPCVVADYLVDYVCKPGYSLDRHILYNTHGCAEKSLKNLISRLEKQEEDAEDVKTPEDDSADDVACQVCGSRNRGEEMLICGDENGVEGCGVAMHIDCLDPPLQHVPDDDWFCPSCCQKREKTRTKVHTSHKRGSKSANC